MNTVTQQFDSSRIAIFSLVDTLLALLISGIVTAADSGNVPKKMQKTFFSIFGSDQHNHMFLNF